jgi:hypothetical protein
MCDGLWYSENPQSGRVVSINSTASILMVGTNYQLLSSPFFAVWNNVQNTWGEKFTQEHIQMGSHKLFST